MAQITSSVGLISGIDTGDLINELVSLDAAPVTLLQTQVSSAQAQEQIYGSLETQLNNIQQIGNTLALPQTFQDATTNSSDPTVLTANANVGAAVGTYQFQVSRLVTTQQSISNGFTDPDTQPVGAGTITLEQGGGEADSQTPLSQLNGGAGVPPGQFRITDRSGASAVIDTSNDITLDDVVKQINSALGISVQASVTDNGLVLTDESGGTANNLTVQDLDGGTTAAALGIAGNSAGTNTLTGTNINNIGTATALNQLNDGNGITAVGGGKTDFTVTLGDGTAVNVALGGATTVGDVINDINTAGAGKLTAAIAANGQSIQLTDSSGGGGTMTVAAQNGSDAAAELGLTTAATGNTIDGKPLIAGLDSVLVSSLNGGSGLPLGTISITNRAEQTGQQINLSGATSVSDIINDINNTPGLDVTASLNASGTGLQIVDNSGGTGNLVISDVNSTTAAALGIAGTFSTATSTVQGKNLQRQYVSGSTLLSNYNGGQGVQLGQFQITNSKGVSATVDLGVGSYNTLGDVMSAIDATNIGVTASIDATGNGILLTDNSGGAGHMSVTDLGGSTAADLNIAGTAATNTIDGTLQKTVTVTASDTLNTLAAKINQLGFGVTASVINDGSSTDPYRLSLTAINSGAQGSVVIDSGATNLGMANLVNGQDAAVFYGGGGSTPPLLITSSTNQITNLIKGVTVNLVGASSSPVTLTVTPDSSNVQTQLSNLVTDFNSLVGTIANNSQFNTSTNTGGILLGDATTQQVQETMYNMINSVVKNNGVYNDLASVGITIDDSGETSGATLDFNTNTFTTAFAANPTAVQNLFSQASTGLGNVISQAMDTLTDPVDGAITLQDNTLNSQIQQYQDSITTLNGVLADQREQLQNEFNAMEETLASLQSQQSIISSLSGAKTTSTAPSYSDSSSSSPSSTSDTSSSDSSDSGDDSSDSSSSS
jgi:flagellar hook-associated protein 2